MDAWAILDINASDLVPSLSNQLESASNQSSEVEWTLFDVYVEKYSFGRSQILSDFKN